MRKILIAASLFTLGHALSLAAPVYRPWGHTLQEGTYEISGDLSLWSTSAVFDTDGEEFELAEGNSFSQVDTNLRFSYGLNKSFTLFGGGRFRQVQAEYSTSGEDFSVTTSGGESFHAGFLYALKDKGKLRYNLEVQFGQSLYTNEEYTSTNAIPNDQVILGDSGSRYQLGINASYLWNKDHYLNGNVFYHQPPNDLSSEVVWNVDSTWLFESWHISLGANGVYSMGGDEFSDNPNLKIAQGRGPSALYNSINRSWLEPRAGLFYSFGNWSIGGVVASRMTGVSTDKGNRFSLQFVRASKGKSVTEIKRNQFKEYRIEGTILKVSPRGRYVQIDQGLTQDVEKGMVFDIFKTDYFGGNEMVASALVHEVGLQKAILKVVKLHSKTKVKKGFVARAQ